MINRIKIVITSVFMFFSSVVLAVDPRLHWNTIESEHFYIHYADGYLSHAQKTANAAEQAHKKLQPIINWQPQDKTHLVVSDETDFANGYATPINFNRSVLFVAPPNSANSLEDFDDWLETLVIHEYVHILHLDKVSEGAEIARNIFGRQFLFFPNAYQPGWFIEGLATYYETDVEKGIGRGQSSLFKMMMRSEMENGIKPANQVNLPMRSWPMATATYLYGVHFYQFIEQTYGHQGIDKLIENYSGNIIPFKINSNAQDVFGKDIDDLWKNFSIWLEKRYVPEIEKYKKIGLQEGKKITDLGYNTQSIDLNKNNEIYYVANGAFEHAALMHQVDGVTTMLSEVHNGAKINTHSAAGVLIIQNENCDEYNINSDLYVFKKGDDEYQRLTECGRYRSASWSADGEFIYAVKLVKGQSHLVMLNKQGGKIKDLWQGNSTDIITQLKSSPAGEKLVASIFRAGKGWNIEEFDLLSLQWQALTNDKFINMYPTYSDKGSSILFSSDRSGRYQIYRYNKKTQQFNQLTRVLSGAFNSVQFDSQSALFYSGYHANGRDIYRLDKVKSLTPSIPFNKVAVDKKIKLAPKVAISKPRDYSVLSSLYPRWWMPFWSLSNDRNEYGFSTSANDALGVHNYVLTMAYDTSNEWLAGNINYSYANRMSLGYQRSTDILRYSNGDFAVARNVDDIYFSLGLTDPGVESRIRYQFGMAASRSSDGRRAVGVFEQPVTQDNLVGVGLLFNDTQNYIRSISQSEGRNVRLLAETSEIFESSFSGEVYTLDWREFLSLGHQHVIALRAVQAWGTEQPKLFRLGGENNEFGLLDFINPVSEPLFDKREYALRGYAEGLPQLAGRRMQLLSLEWRFPSSLIERGFMSPPVGIIQWSGSVFAETGAAYNNASPEQYYSSVGAELQADINLFYGITSRMRLGLASGLDGVIGEERIYFILGTSF